MINTSGSMVFQPGCNATHKTPSVSSAGSTFVVQQEDWELWTHGVRAELHRCDHRGHSYTMWVTKMGRLITCNMKHTALSAEQYIHERIKKAAGWLDDVFMQAAAVNGLPKLGVCDCRMEVILGKIQAYKEWGIREVHPLYNRICSPIGNESNNTPYAKQAAMASHIWQQTRLHYPNYCVRHTKHC